MSLRLTCLVAVALTIAGSAAAQGPLQPPKEFDLAAIDAYLAAHVQE